MINQEEVLLNQLSKQALALVLAGGRGSRLYNLTDRRAKPAVYFGGKFRIIDFVLSNCLNSGIRRIGVVTQYKSHSLLRHLQRGWSFLRGEFNEFIDLLPAQQRVSEDAWYRGTADAVYQNIDILKSYNPKYLVVLAGDHIYKMDYSIMLRDHVLSGKECTVGCIEVSKEEATAFGVMGIDENRNITSFVEKPANPPTIPNDDTRSLASMGIYIFNADYLYELLENDIQDPASSHDFGKDIIPFVVSQNKALAHPFGLSCVPQSKTIKPYWKDVGTIDSLWSANLDLASNMPELNIYDNNWPIWTRQDQLPPAKFVPDNHGRHGDIANSLISNGCIICGSYLSFCVIFSSVKIESFCHLENAVIMPNAIIRENCRLKNVVIDRGCEIPYGTIIGFNKEDDERRFLRTDSGVVLVTEEMLKNL